MSPSENRALKILQNTLYLLGGDMASRFFAWALFAYLCRTWEVSVYGQYALVVNWVSIFIMFSDIGMAPLTVREVAHHNGKAVYYLRNVMVLKSILSVVFWAALIGISFVFHYELVLKTGLAVMGLCIILDSVGAGYTYLFQAHEQMGLCSLASMLSGAIRMIGIVLAVFLGGGVFAACSIWLLASFCSMVVLVVVGIRRGWTPHFPDLKVTELKLVFREALALAPFVGLQFLYYRVDVVILKSLSGNDAVAFYDAASKVLVATLSISQRYCSVLYPVFSSIQEDAKAFGQLAFRSIKNLILISVPITVGGYLLCKPMMIFISGAKYESAGPLFAVLTLSMVPFFLSNIYVDVLAVKNTIRLNLQFLILLLMNVALNFWWIPTLGAKGSAWATVVCEVFGLFLGFGLAARYLDHSTPFQLVKPSLAALAAAAVMGLGIWSDPRLYWLGLGPLVYGAGLWLFGGLSQEDWQSLRSMFKKA